MDLVEDIANILHLNQGGVAPEEFEEVMGSKQKPFSSLEQWQQDEWRAVAGAVVDYLAEKGLVGRA